MDLNVRLNTVEASLNKQSELEKDRPAHTEPKRKDVLQSIPKAGQ